MKALLVYDSVFGNTELLSIAMSKALGPQEPIDVRRVTNVKPEQLQGLDVLMVGSPTRAFKPTPAITHFLKQIPAHSLQGVRVLAFDTRISLADVKSFVLDFLVGIFGYAAQPVARRLVRKGGILAAPPAGFFVKEAKGPLKDDELQRATDWVKSVLGKR